MQVRVTYIARISPEPKINQIMRHLDFFCEGEGAFFEQRMSVLWKEGEEMTPERIDKTAAKLKEAFELQGYECFSVTKEIVELV